MYASMTDQADMVQLLIKMGAVVTTQDPNGQTSMHLAASNVRTIFLKPILFISSSTHIYISSFSQIYFSTFHFFSDYRDVIKVLRYYWLTLQISGFMIWMDVLLFTFPQLNLTLGYIDSHALKHIH